MTGCFVLAQVTLIKGDHISYTSCMTCNSKVNETYTTAALTSWYCGKCKRLLSGDKCRERYRLCMSITDGATCRDVNVFGSSLQPLFGVSAGDLNRHVMDVRSRELLREAIQHVFVGSLFLFGFKSALRCGRLLSHRPQFSPVALSSLAPASRSTVAWQMLAVGGERTSVIAELQRLMRSTGSSDEIIDENIPPSLPLTVFSSGGCNGSAAWSCNISSGHRRTSLRLHNACRFSCDTNQQSQHSGSSSKCCEVIDKGDRMEESIELARHNFTHSQSSIVGMQSLVVDVDFDEAMGFCDNELSSCAIDSKGKPTGGLLESFRILSEQSMLCQNRSHNVQQVIERKSDISSVCDGQDSVDEMTDSGVTSIRQSDSLRQNDSSYVADKTCGKFSQNHRQKLLSCMDKGLSLSSDSGLSTLTSINLAEYSGLKDLDTTKSKHNHNCATSVHVRMQQKLSENSEHTSGSEFNQQSSFSEKCETLPYSEDIDEFLQNISVWDSDVSHVPKVSVAHTNISTAVTLLDKRTDNGCGYVHQQLVTDSQKGLSVHTKCSVNDPTDHHSTTSSSHANVSHRTCLSTSSVDLFNSSSSDLDVSANSAREKHESLHRRVDNKLSNSPDKCRLSMLKEHPMCVKHVHFASTPPNLKSTPTNQSLLHSQDLFAFSPIDGIRSTPTSEMESFCSGSDSDDIIPPSFVPLTKTSSPMLSLPVAKVLTSSNAASPELFSQAPLACSNNSSLQHSYSQTEEMHSAHTDEVHSQDLFSDSSLFSSHSVCKLDF